MKIVFRIHFRTVPGQSLWVRLAAFLHGSDAHLAQWVQLHWINEGQWEGEVELHGSPLIRLEYHYQLREAVPSLVLDEWRAPRVIHVQPIVSDTLLLLDTWCSAATVDYAYETKAMRKLLPPRGPFHDDPAYPAESHTFLLPMAAVPNGYAPCLIGGPREMGSWGWHHSLPMKEISPNLWQVHVNLPANFNIEYKYGLYDPKLGCAVRLESGPNRILPPHACSLRQRTVVRDEAYRRESADLLRAAGVAIPVFSLRSEASLGTGEFADLVPFAHWASKVGMKLIQILPINDTTTAKDWTDSYPYAAVSVFALHPIYLRVSDLPYEMPPDFHEEFESTRDWLNTLEHVDYEAVMQAKHGFTRQIFTAHRRSITRTPEFLAFLAANQDWLLPYALFLIKQETFHTSDFSQWGEWAVFHPEMVRDVASPNHPDWPEISYHLWIQFELDRQLSSVVAELTKLGVALKGDLPIGIDRHSVDAWTRPDWFHMDAQTGAPPDAFAIKGQNWGFPTYHWEAMARDGFSWWHSRFSRLSRYFDAYRIDHILGFFRIWSIPTSQVEGLMGRFEPAKPISLEEFAARGIPFDYQRFCRPFLRGASLWERFGDSTERAKNEFLTDIGGDLFQLRDHVDTQRKIVDLCDSLPCNGPCDVDAVQCMRQALLDCVADVLFFEEPGSGGTRFHPRWGMEKTRSFLDLDSETRQKLQEISIDYFHYRQEKGWRAQAYQKLPTMRRASEMLLCGEDLGVVPACVPGTLADLGILSLEIQRMPKALGVEFANPAHAPYHSVVSPSTHDMPTLRAWWREDPLITGRFAWQALGITFPPMDMTPEIAETIIAQHLASPAMWSVFSLQDLLALDADLRHPDPEAERINVPSIMPFYWHYRCHLSVEDLSAATEFNEKISGLVRRHCR